MKKRRNKDNENEGIGIVSIIVIMALAVMGLYYFFAAEPNSRDDSNAPIESPAPLPNNANN